MKRRGALVPAFVAALAMALSACGTASAAGLRLDPVGSFTGPVFVTSDPANADRLFVVQKGGEIVISENGAEHTFLDISGKVNDSGEQGLLSMAFDPAYETNHRFYVYYSAKPKPGENFGNIHIAEFTADDAGITASPETMRTLLVIDHHRLPNHNGGQLQIGPDGYLYAGTGDGGGAGDTLRSGQDLDSQLGKILRLDPDPSAGKPYTVPPDNPFVGKPGDDLIWSYGVRNPWRFSFDSKTGALVIGDVGQDAWEEIDYSPQAPAGDGGRGANFGWNCREGMHAFGGTLDPQCTSTPSSAFTDPVFEYKHENGRCSITGGYVDRDPGTPSMNGRYLYADLCTGEIRSLIPGDGTATGATGDRSENLTVGNASSFGEDACGRLYVAGLSDSKVWRIEGSTPTDCGTPPPPPDNGPCAPSTQLGDGGPNVLDGTDGRDRLSGLAGDDTLSGLGGIDCLAGGPDADTLNGGRARDRIYPGGGADTVMAGRGPDRIRARDALADTISCGKGKDSLVADTTDEVAKNCEKVSRYPVEPGPRG